MNRDGWTSYKPGWWRHDACGTEAPGRAVMDVLEISKEGQRFVSRSAPPRRCLSCEKTRAEFMSEHLDGAIAALRALPAAKPDAVRVDSREDFEQLRALGSRERGPR